MRIRRSQGQKSKKTRIRSSHRRDGTSDDLEFALHEEYVNSIGIGRKTRKKLFQSLHRRGGNLRSRRWVAEQTMGLAHDKADRHVRMCTEMASSDQKHIKTRSFLE